MALPAALLRRAPASVSAVVTFQTTHLELIGLIAPRQLRITLEPLYLQIMLALLKAAAPWHHALQPCLIYNKTARQKAKAGVSVCVCVALCLKYYALYAVYSGHFHQPSRSVISVPLINVPMAPPNLSPCVRLVFQMACECKMGCTSFPFCLISWSSSQQTRVSSASDYSPEAKAPILA